MSESRVVTFFSDFYESIEGVTSDEEFGAIMRAAFEYQLYGTEYQGDNKMVKMAFLFAKGQTDRKKEFSDARRKNARRRWEDDDGQDAPEYTPTPPADREAPREKTEAMQTDASGCKPMGVDASAMQTDGGGCKSMGVPCKPMQVDAPGPGPYPGSSPNPSSLESKAPAKGKTAPVKTFGRFGWVKLSDAQYRAIINDLGQAEAERCIAYIDESAQSTGNKNKWRDWNLVVRKCHRDGWGLRSNGYHRPEKPGDIHGCGPLGQAEMEAIERVLHGNVVA